MKNIKKGISIASFNETSPTFNPSISSLLCRLFVEKNQPQAEMFNPSTEHCRTVYRCGVVSLTMCQLTGDQELVLVPNVTSVYQPGYWFEYKIKAGDN